MPPTAQLTRAIEAMQACLRLLARSALRLRHADPVRHASAMPLHTEARQRRHRLPGPLDQARGQH